MFVITNLNTMIFICKCLNMHGVIIYVIYYKPIVYTFLLIKLRQKVKYLVLNHVYTV